MAHELTKKPNFAKKYALLGNFHQSVELILFTEIYCGNVHPGHVTLIRLIFDEITYRYKRLSNGMSSVFYRMLPQSDSELLSG